MLCIPTSLVAAVAPRTRKFIKKWPQCFWKRGDDLLQNSKLQFVFRFSQLSEIALEIA